MLSKIQLDAKLLTRMNTFFCLFLTNRQELMIIGTESRNIVYDSYSYNMNISLPNDTFQ